MTNLVCDLAREARSVRRFRENEPVPVEVLRKLVQTAGLAPCAANLQQLRFSIINDGSTCGRLFPLLKWAGYLEGWPGPAPGERPAAYIVIHAPSQEKPFTRIDAGIAAGYMTLAARAAGLSSCLLLSFDRERIPEVVESPDGMSAMLVMAVGAAAEEVTIEPLEPGGDVRYWRDGTGRHHVPKLSLDDLLLPQGSTKE
ncbi:nitroreductase [Candidatus Fermentibacteria bacterium]|nr:nitroreductase [Candidatus Fermentibacteria bacterium]